MKKVLIVDNDPAAAAELADLLGDYDCECKVATSAREAQDRLPAMQPDLCVVEMALGNTLGFQVARTIRRHPGIYKTPVLFCSGGCEPRDIEIALQEGGDEFLRKPYSVVEVAQKMQLLDQLQESLTRPCPYTGFFPVPALKREIEHSLSRREDFALCYFFPRGLTKLRTANQLGQIQQIAKVMAGLARQTVKNDGFYESFTCHLGGSHFMVKLGNDDYKRFFKCFSSRYADASSNGTGNGTSLPSSKLHFGVTYNNERRRYRFADDVFADLQRLKLSEESQRISVSKSKIGHDHWAD